MNKIKLKSFIFCDLNFQSHKQILFRADLLKFITLKILQIFLFFFVIKSYKYVTESLF